MAKGIKTRKPKETPPVDEPKDEATPSPVYASEAEHFAAESVVITYTGPDKGVHVAGRALRHGESIRVWPSDAAQKKEALFFRDATAEEIAALPKCCDNCKSGIGDCAVKETEQ